MTSRIHRSFLLNKKVFSCYSLSYKTKGLTGCVFKRTKSDCSSVKFENCELTKNSVESISSEKMPVITAVAVAAHRQHHHDHPNHLHHVHTIHKRFSLLNLSSSLDKMDPSKTVLRSNSFHSTGSEIYYRNLLDVNQMKAPLQPNNETRRFYAKGKDKPKNKKSVVNINETEMGEIINVESLKVQLEKNLEQMKDEFSKQLSVRGAAGALETLIVEFEGETYPLQELAQIGRKNPQLAVLNLSSLPDACQPVLKAIQDSGMNLNPQQEGTTIYVPLPKVTREHRENLSKNAKVLFNKYKISFHGVQNKFVKQCKSQSDASEDLIFSVQQQIMKLTESYVDDAEKLLHLKQKELLENK